MGTRPTALILDDSLTVRMDLAEACEAAGFLPVLAATLAEGRAALARGPVALAILDVVLPDGSGIDLLREIRHNPGPAAPVVLLLSSEADVHDRIHGIQIGADDYVGKPYDRGYVTARARELLRARDDRVATRATILIIDDSVTFREELKSALESSNYAVVTAASGEEGLRVADSIRPAAILVDSVMAGIDGATVIRRVRLDAALRATPCVLLTASDDDGAELRALDAGADAFVRKGDLEIVLARIWAVLRATSLQPTVAVSALGPKRVLVIDDSGPYLEALIVLLRDEGYELVQARSDEEALAMLGAQQFDCILLDLIMPGIDALETCRSIKASQFLRDVPLIMLTSGETRRAMFDSLASGADDFIAKSSEPHVLKARVRAQLRRKEFEDEHRVIREKALHAQVVAAEARAARELAEARQKLVTELEEKNQELTRAYLDLQTAQTQLVQSAKLASLGELVAGVAHEINNPLAFVSSHLSTVRRAVTKLDEGVSAALAPDDLLRWRRATTRLGEMQGGLLRMRDLVLKLRTFSRLDEGERKIVSITECVDSVLTMLRYRFAERIVVQTSYGQPDLVDCQPGPLTQAIMNLMTNAIDAIDGNGRIAVSTGAVEGEYRISIVDSGCGIPAHVRERMLDPFFTTKPVGQGTGLGLSITDAIVRKHGGSLEFHAATAGGTEAILRFPLA